MKTLNVAQRSVEWMQARAGIPTASEFDQLVTPEFKIRTGEMRKSYLAKKLAEAWLGGPLPQFNSFDMDQGNILEEEAIPWYELEFGTTIERVGLLTTDDGRIGCSPDGLLKDGGIEIKCPLVQTHIGYLLAGELPKQYAAQVHGSMFVSGLPRWTFISYHRKLPALHLIIERDSAIDSAIQKALAEFLADFDASMKQLEELNGGPPRRPAPMQPVPVGDEREQDVPIP
jgi:hypothetical protein